jgi:hypothetical protein
LRLRRRLRFLVLGTAAVIAAAGIPTVAIDVYNSQDLTNRELGPGFRWTVILSHDEITALEWIRKETPADAVVQVEPYVRGRDTWSYLPAFAARRMAAGLPISMVPLRPYEEASERIRALFRLTEATRIYLAAIDNGIGYLVVGDPERTAYPQFELALQSKPHLFVERIRAGPVTVFQVRIPGAGRRVSR